MTPEESARMTPITSKLATRCVGRYLIDLPEVFELNPVHLNKIENVEMSIRPMTRIGFDAALKARRVNLEAERIHGEDARTLKGMTELAGVRGLVFDRAKSQSSNFTRELELRAWVNGFEVMMTIEAEDASFWEGPAYFPLKTTTPEKLDHLLKLFARTRPRADLDIPTEQGVCFANGFVAGPPTGEEDIVLRYTVRGEEDGQFVFHSMSSLGAESDTLLDRESAILADLKNRKGRKLRSGTVRANGLEVQEWLEFAPHEQTKIDTYAFTAEMNSKQGNAQAPFFGIDFGSGFGRSRLPESLDAMASRPRLAKALFNEAESVALWDSALPTLRKRPGAF